VWIVPPLLTSLGFRPLVMIFGGIGLVLCAYSLTARRLDASGRSVDESSHDTELQQVRTTSPAPGYSPVPLPHQ
jgi:hypothetical protein